MKYSEITLQSLAQGLKRQWILVVLSIVLFAAIGAGASILWSDQLSAEGSGSVAPLAMEPIEMDEIEQNYYRTYYAQLQQHSENLHEYLRRTMLDHTITSEQSEALNTAMDAIMKYQKTVLEPIDEKLSDTSTIYIPKELYQETLRDYEKQYANCQEALLISESAVDLLKSMGALTSTDATINETYATLLAQAARYGSLQVDLQHNAAILDQLKNQPQLIRSQSEELELQLEEAQTALDTLGEETHSLLQEVAETNHLDLAATPTAEELVVTVSHTNRPATAQEAMMAMMVFCGLVGLAAGMYFAVWRDTRKKNA